MIPTCNDDYVCNSACSILVQPQLITSSNTMDKKTLLKASAIIGSDLSSHSTGSFKGFYSSDQPLPPPILVSPVQPGNRQLQSHLGLQDDDDPEDMKGYKFNDIL